MMESMEWRFLPCEGGLLDQPESLMEDLMMIAWLRGKLEDMLNPPPEGAEVVTKTLRRGRT